MFFFILLFMQIHIIFSMEKPITALEKYTREVSKNANDTTTSSVDFYLNLNNVPTPSFNTSSLIAFFSSAELQNFSCKVHAATEALIKKIISANPDPWQNAETTARIIEAQKYPCNIAILFQNSLIINAFKKCLVPIPAEYVETEKNFKNFWYELWKLIIPKEKEQQQIINPYLTGLLNTALKKRITFINFFDLEHHEIDDICMELIKIQSIMENFIKTVYADDESISLYKDMLLTIQRSFEKLNHISAEFYFFKESYIHLNKRKYIRKHELTAARAYPDFGKINEQWKHFWQSSSLHEQRFATAHFNIELNKYLTFLQSHLLTIDTFIL